MIFYILYFSNQIFKSNQLEYLRRYVVIKQFKKNFIDQSIKKIQSIYFDSPKIKFDVFIINAKNPGKSYYKQITQQQIKIQAAKKYQFPTKRQMKSFIRYQIIPLTLKQLKQAQIQCKQSKSKAFENSTYEYIEVIARVTKSTSFDITISDQTESIRLPLMANIVRKAADIVVNRYYKVTLAAKKSFGSDGFPYEVESMLWVDPNEVTLHMLRCLKEKIRREECMEQSQGRNTENDHEEMNTDSTINDYKQSSKLSSVSNSTGNNSSSSSSRSTLLNKVFEDILDYVRGLKQDFDADIILAQFDGRVSKPQIQEWIEDMCEKGQIMNLGMVYEWAGDEEE